MYSGLSGEKGDLEHRQDVFGSNTIPPKPPKTFLEVIIHSDSHYKTLDQVKDDFTRIFPFFSSVTNCLFSAGMGGPARRHPHHPGGTDPTFFKHLKNMPCPQQLFWNPKQIWKVLNNFFETLNKICQVHNNFFFIGGCRRLPCSLFLQTTERGRRSVLSLSLCFCPKLIHSRYNLEICSV